MPMRRDKDHRQKRRRSITYPVTAESAEGEVLPCRVLDISETGVRINLADPSAVADTFRINLASGHEYNRICEVIWRSRDELGARFVWQDAR
jgi:hypothetical protein